MHTFALGTGYDSGVVGDDIGLGGGFKALKRKVGAVVAGTSPLGLFVQPQVLGVRSKKSQALYTKAQRISRIAVGTVATVFTAGAAAGAMGFGGAGATPLMALKAMGFAGITKVKDFLIAKGVKPTDALGLAKDIVAGQRPMPPELDAQLQAEMAARGGGPLAPGAGGLAPILVLGGLGVAAMAFMRSR